MDKIGAVYKIVNTVTGDFYIGSSRNVKRRWAQHKYPSKWNQCPNSPLYQDMQKYGIDKFRFQILVPVMPEYLKQVEQEFIEMLKPTYNDRYSKGLDVGKIKVTHKESNKKYFSQLCEYNDETLTLNALSGRFYRADIPNPVLEAKKYLV